MQYVIQAATPAPHLTYHRCLTCPSRPPPPPRTPVPCSSPVCQVDGRKIGNGCRGPVTSQLQELYLALKDSYVAAVRSGAGTASAVQGSQPAGQV